MVNPSRIRVAELATAALSLRASSDETYTCPVAGEMPVGDLANHFAPLPGHVNLPGGFYPLVGQYDPDNPDDHYDGWPRYIVCEADGMTMAYVPSQTLLMGGGPRRKPRKSVPPGKAVPSRATG